MISSLQSPTLTQPQLPQVSDADVDSSSLEQAAESENLKPTKDVVEFKEAGALAQIVVAVKTKFNESQRLVDVVA